MKLIHSELVNKIAQNTRKEPAEVDLIMDALRFSVRDALQKEGDIAYIKGIGSFSLVLRKGKVDMLTGEERMTSDKLVIQFKPSKGLSTWIMEEG